MRAAAPDQAAGSQPRWAPGRVRPAAVAAVGFVPGQRRAGAGPAAEDQAAGRAVSAAQQTPQPLQGLAGGQFDGAVAMGRMTRGIFFLAQ